KLKEKVVENQNKVLEDIAFIQSHEVRRPVANILGLISLLDKNNLSEEQAQIIEYLEKSTQDLDEIIHKILHKTYILDI
ncbi:MAG: histidine kinase dimerization/phospho-acceptor domain-containing protein, partial [Raineya sp.]